MKKILCSFIAAVLLLTGCTENVVQDTENVAQDSDTGETSQISFVEEIPNLTINPRVENHYWDKYVSQTPKSLLTDNQRELYERFEECCNKYLYSDEDFPLLNLHYKDEITGEDKEKLSYICGNVKVDDLNMTLEETKEVYIFFMLNSPQFYFLDGFNATTDDGHFIFSCLYDENLINGKIRQTYTDTLFNEVQEIVDSIDPTLSNAEKAARVADIILDNTDVVESEYSSSAYWALVLGNAMCQGYSGAYALIMNGLGIDTFLVVNTLHNHTWNMAKLDDKYYMTDIANIDGSHEEPEVRDRLLNVSYETILTVKPPKEEVEEETEEEKNVLFNMSGAIMEKALELVSETDYPVKY